MNQLLKWLSLLLAGVMMSATLLACAGDEEDEKFEKYADLCPSELYEALLDADEYVITLCSEFKMEGQSYSATQKLTRDGDLFLSESESDAPMGFAYTCYYDFDDLVIYTQDVHQNWQAREIDPESDSSTVQQLVDDFVGERLLEDEHYQDFDPETERYVMKSSYAEENGCESVYIQVKESTYTICAVGNSDSMAREVECTIRFQSASVNLPNSDSLLDALFTTELPIAVTTVPPFTTEPPVTTTQKPEPPMITTVPIETDPDEVITLPVLPGLGLEELLAGKTGLTQQGKVDQSSIATYGFRTWNEEYESARALFDGVDTFYEWYYDEYGNLKDGADPSGDFPMGGGPGKCAGSVTDPTYFYFALTERVKVSAYVITTGNDNSIWPGRNPIEWTLYGTNDLAAFEASSLDGEEFDKSKWAKLDYVYDGAMLEDNFAACGYEIDEENQGAYRYYVWVLGYNASGTFQVAEFELYAD